MQTGNGSLRGLHERTVAGWCYTAWRTSEADELLASGVICDCAAATRHATFPFSASGALNLNIDWFCFPSHLMYHHLQGTHTPDRTAPSSTRRFRKTQDLTTIPYVTRPIYCAVILEARTCWIAPVIQTSGPGGEVHQKHASPEQSTSRAKPSTHTSSSSQGATRPWKADAR